MTDNIITKKKRDTRQTRNYKILHRRRKIKQHDPNKKLGVKSGSRNLKVVYAISISSTI